MFNNIFFKINCQNCYYIDITEELLDKETNTCKKYFIRNGDHHLKACTDASKIFKAIFCSKVKPFPN